MVVHVDREVESVCRARELLSLGFLRMLAVCQPTRVNIVCNIVHVAKLESALCHMHLHKTLLQNLNTPKRQALLRRPP